MPDVSPPALRRPETLRHQVENYLRDAITSGRFPPGQRLVERELCEMLDISRASLREAIRKLEAEKLVKIVPHRGPTVAAITPEEAKELYAIRRLLEGYAAHEFARLACDEAIASLQQAVKTLRQVAAQDERGSLLAAKADFYQVLLGGCGNQVAAEILMGLLSRINLLRAASFSHPERLPASLAEIEHLLKCIQARDPAGAQEAANRHILNAEAAALAVIHPLPPLTQENRHE